MPTTVGSPALPRSSSLMPCGSSLSTVIRRVLAWAGEARGPYLDPHGPTPENYRPLNNCKRANAIAEYDSRVALAAPISSLNSSRVIHS